VEGNVEEKHILNLGKKEALCVMVRNHFYNGNWDKMITELKSGYFKGLISLQTIQLLRNYEEKNHINLSSIAFKSISQTRCAFRQRHRSIKNCKRKKFFES
jgi:hypothetical protein